MVGHRPATSTRHERGFTIAELVLVLAVFAGLIFIAVVSVNGIDDESAARDCRSELRAIKAATERFYAEVGFYPPDDKALQDAGFLDQNETPNWKVVTFDDADGPTYKRVGSRCK